MTDAGMTLLMRWQPNDFGVPFFSALLADTHRWNPGFLNSGFGCHPDAEVALVRAVTEAVQSRGAGREPSQRVRLLAAAMAWREDAI